MRCIRCGGLTYKDPDGDLACLMCGWRDYRVAQARALAEEAERESHSAAWRDDGYTDTRVSKRLSRRRNR